jgi:hypothetical protein
MVATGPSFTRLVIFWLTDILICQTIGSSRSARGVDHYFQDLHACDTSLLHHIGRASFAGKSDNKIRLPFLGHLSVSNRASGAAVRLPIGWKGPNGNTLPLAELARLRVGSSRAAFDDFGYAVIVVDFAESQGQHFGINEVDDGIWLASFMHYDLGYFDLEQKTLQPLDNPFGTRLSPMS